MRSPHRSFYLTPGHGWVVTLIKLMIVVFVVVPAAVVSVGLFLIWLTVPA